MCMSCTKSHTPRYMQKNQRNGGNGDDDRQRYCREYREAKDKKKQIDIIADQLPGMSRDDVIKVLVDCGEMEPPAEKPKRQPSKKPGAVPEMPEPVKDALFARMDAIDREIKPLEDQRKELDEKMEPLSREFNEILAFLRGYGLKGAEG